MVQIHDRIREIRKSLNISQREFSKRIFISQSLYAEIEIGKVKPKERFLKLISSEFKVNLDWIKTGIGDKYSSNIPDLRLEQLFEIFNKFNPETQDEILSIMKSLLKIHKKK